MKKKTMMAAFLLGAGLLSAGAQTLSVGNYDDFEDNGDPGVGTLYDGSAWEVSPINYYYTNSGTQILLTKDQLADMAGKSITELSFPYYCEGAYIDGIADVKVYLTETNQSDFYKDNDTKKYRYFDVKRASQQYNDKVEIDTYSYDYMTGFLTITFSTTFYYTGENNLVVTIDATGVTDNTSGAFYVNFFDSGEGKALTFAQEKYDLGSILDDDCFAKSQYSISVINAPVLQFTYTNGTTPEAEWFSYVPAQDEDLDINGFEAYKVTGVESGYATLERVTAAQAGEALIVKSSVVPSVSLSSSATKQTDNSLKVSDGSVTGGDGIYALSKADGVVGFRNVASSVTIPSGKVYLETTASAKPFIAIENATTTGIKAVGGLQLTADSDAPAYNLAGQRVNAQYKGVIIQNGVKKIQK